MSDRIIPHLLYTADPTAAPVVGEFYEAMKADPNGALWIRPIAGGAAQTADNPDADGVNPAAVWALDVRCFNYIWDPVAGAWDREQRFVSADNMPDVEARTVLSFNMGYDSTGTDWDRMRNLVDNVNNQAAEGAGLQGVVARLQAVHVTSGNYDRLAQGGCDADAIGPYNAGLIYSRAFATGFNGATWDRLRTLVDNADAQAAAVTGILGVVARLQGLASSNQYERLTTQPDNTDALADGKIGLLGVVSHGYVFNSNNWMRNWKSAAFQPVTSGNVGAVSTSILAQQDTRRYLLIQNTHATQTLYINFGAAAAATTLAIGPGASYEPLIVPTNEIFAYGSGAATTYVITRA